MGRLVASVLLAALCACGDDVAVDLTIDADPCMVELIERIEVRVVDEMDAVVDVFEASDELEFPTGVRVISSDASRSWHVEIVAYAGGDVPIGYQNASGSFESEVSRRGVLLADECLGIECDAGTCIAGECSSAAFESVMPNPRPATCPGLAFADGDDGVEMPCGSADAPCASGQHAINTLSGTGGIVFLAGGSPYTDDDGVVLDIDVEESRLVVRPWPGTGRPIVEGTDEAIDIDARDVVIDGLEVRNASRHGININGDDNERVTIRNCEIHSNGDSESMFDTHAAIGLNNGASDVLIENNVLRDNVTSFDRRDSGVHANNSPGLVVRGNRIEGNSRIGIFTNGGTADVIDNVIFGNGSSGLIHDGEGEVRGNRICANSDRGIIARTNGPILYNTIVDNGAAAIHFTTSSTPLVTNNILAYNGIGLSSDGTADPDDGPNLYFMNDERFDMVIPDMESADVIADPLFVRRDDCSLELMDGSPARGESPETSFGAR